AAGVVDHGGGAEALVGQQGHRLPHGGVFADRDRVGLHEIRGGFPPQGVARRGRGFHGAVHDRNPPLRGSGTDRAALFSSTSARTTAARMSVLETMPIGRPRRSTTMARWMWASSIIRATSPIGACGATVTGSAVM